MEGLTIEETVERWRDRWLERADVRRNGEMDQLKSCLLVMI